jgi:hypothetical protein
MPPRPSRPILDDVTTTHIVIGLELRQTEDTLTGRITVAGGEVLTFSGWLGLVAALDALVHPLAEGAEGGGTPPPIPTKEGATP